MESLSLRETFKGHKGEDLASQTTGRGLILTQALNFALEGVQQFSSGEGQIYEENASLYWNLAEGTTSMGDFGTLGGSRLTR